LVEWIFPPPLMQTELGNLKLIQNLRSTPSLGTPAGMLRAAPVMGTHCVWWMRKGQLSKIQVHLRQVGLPPDRRNTCPLAVKFLRILMC